MKRTRGFFAFVCTIALALSPRIASAQLDHLVCYKVVDKTQVAVAFDLFSKLQPEFAARGCKPIKVVNFCVPATKVNVTPAEADVRADVTGPGLYVDYIGYLVKCENEIKPSNKIVIDQFGTHRHRKYKIERVYVPAKKGPPPCGTVDGKNCGGVCPNKSDQCTFASDGSCNCQPIDTCAGKPDKQGHCGGPCPALTDQCQLIVGTSGAIECGCAPPPPPLCSMDAATGQCGGECPNRAEKCVLKSNFDCTCEPADTACALETGTTGTCSGDCPIAGDVCTFIAATNECRCGAGDPTPCSQNPLTGTCGGECPAPEVCRISPTTNECGCGPAPCASDANGVCGGVCPDATQQCKLDAAGGCNCDPPSCGQDATTGTCGGACPTAFECRIVAGTNVCRCQQL
jgi:hypothetical protein